MLPPISKPMTTQKGKGKIERDDNTLNKKKLKFQMQTVDSSPRSDIRSQTATLQMIFSDGDETLAKCFDRVRRNSGAADE